MQGDTDDDSDDDGFDDDAPERVRFRDRKLLRFLTAILGLMIACGIAGAIGLVLVFAYFSHDLPDYHSLADYVPATMTRLYADDGSLMQEYAAQRRIFTPFNEIPAKLRESFISAEDKNFYHNPGVDALGILRALLANLKNHGKEHSLVGGSTITQQVVKNFLLTNEKSYKRKITEAILAFRITKTYSKDKVLELYLNEIYLGHSAYGVTAAAQAYFGKDLAALSTEEMALLAAMPKEPGYFDPYAHPERVKPRRDYVIGRMLEDGYINKAEADRAKAAPIALSDGSNQEQVSAAYFSEEVRRRLERTYGRDKLYKGGLYVETTLDSRLQPLADHALRSALMLYDRRHGWRGPLTHFDTTDDWETALSQFRDDGKVPLYDEQKFAVVLAVDPKEAKIGVIGPDESGAPAKGAIPFEEMHWATTKGVPARKPADVAKPGDVLLVTPLEGKEGQYALQQIPAVNGALIAMEPATGRVLALSGGYSDRGNQFNRATQALRQPGSSFKPFVYLTAMEHGFTPSSIVVDGPISLYQGPGLPMWTPKNYEAEYLGPATLRMGLEKSRNLMTVRLAQSLGINKIADSGERFGIYDEIPKSQRNYSMVLGAMETTLAKLTAGYAAIANGGFKVQPTFVERIDDAGGHTIYKRDERECTGCAVGSEGFSGENPPILADARERIVDPRIAYQVTHMLEGVILRGTATSAKVLNIPLAGKTGTTNESRDTWFVGFTPDIVVGVFVGYDHPATLGSKETGGRVALPGFIEFMKGALEFYPAKPFEAPPGIVFRDVDYHTGQPILPWLGGGGQVINEAYVTGAPIFLPGRKPAEGEAAADDTNAGDDEADGNTTEDTAAAPAAVPSPPQAIPPAMPAAPAPAESVPDTYRAYQEQRLQNYQQQYQDQRNATSQGTGYPPPSSGYTAPAPGYSPPGYSSQAPRPRNYTPPLGGYGHGSTVQPPLQRAPHQPYTPPPPSNTPAATGTGGLY